MQNVKFVACGYDSIIQTATSVDDKAESLAVQLTGKYDIL
jgi:hypothetical protein